MAVGAHSRPPTDSAGCHSHSVLTLSVERAWRRPNENKDSWMRRRPQEDTLYVARTNFEQLV